MGWSCLMGEVRVMVNLFTCSSRPPARAHQRKKEGEGAGSGCRTPGRPPLRPVESIPSGLFQKIGTALCANHAFITREAPLSSGEGTFHVHARGEPDSKLACRV